MNALPEGCSIVRMEAAHIPALAAMERVCFSTPWSAAAFEEELRNPLAFFLVALRRGEPIGYAGMNYVLDEGSVDNIAVLPQYQRRGIAAALLGALMDFARQRGLAVVTLEVRRSNAGAIRLYERAGFRTVGERRGYYVSPREDALIMLRSLEVTPDGENN